MHFSMGCPADVLLPILLLLLSASSAASSPFYPRHPCHRRTLSQCENPMPFSFYWEIKRPPPSPNAYLFGTIHVPYTKVWDSIPQIAKDAFNSSDRIVFELDLLNEVTHSRLTKCQMLPTGSEIGSILPRKMLQRLEQHLSYVKSQIPKWMRKHYRSNGFNESDHFYKSKTDKWERKSPVWIMMMLNSLTENDVKMYGVPVLDLFLAYEARQLSKEIGSVERPKDQCNPLNSLDLKHAIFALNQTLQQHENIRRGTYNIDGSNTDELIKHYNCGNLNDIVFNQSTSQLPFLKNPLHKITSEELQISKQIDDYFRAQLIVNRNKRMSRQILHLLSANPNESLFFAFGAGHFIGKDSIIELLQNSGLEVVHVLENRPLGCAISPYASIRPAVGYPRARPAASISANLGPPSPLQPLLTSNTNARKGLARNPFVTISPESSWMEDINRRAQLFKQTGQQQHHHYHFPSKPFLSPALATVPPPSLLSPAYFGSRGSTWRNPNLNPAMYSSPVQSTHISNSTSRHHISLNDLLVRAYILNNNNKNLHYAAHSQWPRAIHHMPVYRTEDAHLSSSNGSQQQQQQQHLLWPYLSSSSSVIGNVSSGHYQPNTPLTGIFASFLLTLLTTHTF